MRSWLRGLVAGFTLSLVRAPLGIELLQWPAISGETAYTVRALALAAVALGIAPWIRSDLGWSVLAGAAIGFAAHGLLLADCVALASRSGLAITLVLAVLAMGWLRPRASSKSLDSASTPFPPATLLELLGLALASAGAAVAIEAVARHVRVLGAGTPQDDSVFGAVLLFGIAIGAGSFGWMARARATRQVLLPTLLALAAASTYGSLRVIAMIADYRGLDAYLHHYGLSVADQGTLAYDALIAGSMFIVPSFAVGTALVSARGAARVLSVLLGASLGLHYLPALFASDPQTLASAKALFSAQLVPIATLVAVGGGAVAIVACKELGAVARWTGLTVVLLAASLPIAIATKPLVLLSPWRKFPVMPFVTLETPAGMLTVEPSRGGLKLATLDRRAMSPETSTSMADAELLRASVSLASSADGASEILLIGQMTPVRWLVLQRAGVTRVDRTGAWSAAMARIESELFGEGPRPPGEILVLDEARDRLRAGRYALVIAPPEPSQSPHYDASLVPDRTQSVAWLDFDGARGGWSEASTLVLSGDGFEHPALGVVLAPNAMAPGPNAPLLLHVGTSDGTSLPIGRLLEREFDRTQRARMEWAARLARGERGGAHEKLTRGLELFYAAQKSSSPFESKEEQVELPTEALDLFLASALEEPDNAFIRALWDSLARTLVGKRAIAEIERYVAPLAERYRPSPTLEKVLAHAELESLEPEAAARRLAPLALAEPKDFGLWYFLGEAQSQAGDHAAAVASWKRALSLNPEHEPTRKKLAMALVRVGDPEGKSRIAELLRAHPGDTTLEVFLGAGPYPPPEIGYTPESWSDPLPR